jgi:hypothetical protein
VVSRCGHSSPRREFHCSLFTCRKELPLLPNTCCECMFFREIAASNGSSGNRGVLELVH